jgi:hypothetical protein
VAQDFWKEISEITRLQIGTDFELLVAKLWLLGKKFKVVNALTSAVLWTIWKLRNGLCFQGIKWTDPKELLRSVRMLRDRRL